MSFLVLKAKVTDIKLCCMNKVLTTPKAGEELLLVKNIMHGICKMRAKCLAERGHID